MLHLSTLVHQVLSVVGQFGAARPLELWRALCDRGPFAAVSQSMFADLLRSLGQRDLLVQLKDCSLMPGQVGERIVNHYSFYAVFATPEEYRIVTGAEQLGTLPIEYPLTEHAYLIFAGPRWLIVSVDADAKVVQVSPAAAGVVPWFNSSVGVVHDRVREEMLRIYLDEDMPAYLDEVARALLTEGWGEFRRAGLEDHFAVETDRDVLLLPWCGDRAMNAMLLMLLSAGLPAARDCIALSITGCTADQLHDCLLAVVADPTVADGDRLAQMAEDKVTEKYHWTLDDALLCAEYAASRIDCQGALGAVRRMLSQWSAA